MAIQLIQIENVLIFPRMSVQSRYMYILRWLIVLTAFGLSWLLPALGTIVVIMVFIFPVLSSFWHQFKFPVNYWPLKMIRNGNILQVGKRKFKMEDLLFLSFQQDEFHHIIRLEAKRESILIANEAQLINHCSGFDEALSLCRQIRSFIDPNLKINYKRRAQGKREDMGWGSGSMEFEAWEYLD